MNIRSLILYSVLALTAFSCKDQNSQSQVVSQKYIHKYGYAVSEEEWASKNFPGQVVSTMKDGVVITATYENHELHGPCTYTYPNSQTVEKYVMYNGGEIVKEVSYDIQGMPQEERIKLSPTRHSLTLWYSDGAPRSVEEFASEELLEGQYFTVLNEVEARVEKGNGERVMRDAKGTLLFKDDVTAGYTVKREEFYPSGSPSTITYYKENKMDGERSTFGPGGEPLSVEQWQDGMLHGTATYFKNGTKYQEISYEYGKKSGLETFFLDGDSVSHQISWINDKKHGPEVYYIDGDEKTSYFWDGREISKSSFNEQKRLDEILFQVRPESSYR